MDTDIRALIGDTDPETLSAPEVLGVMVEHFHPKLSLACSFQQEESVLLDMLLAIAPDARVFALDTHVLFPETYDVWRQVEKRYGIEVEVYQGPSLGRQAAIHGDALWERNPSLCCSIRKVGPLGSALAELDGWITGMRREQSATRAGAEARLGRATRAVAGQPARRLDRGRCRRLYRGAGAAGQRAPRAAATPRSVARTAPQPGAGREGRWTGNDKTECGLHLDA